MGPAAPTLLLNLRCLARVYAHAPSPLRTGRDPSELSNVAKKELDVATTLLNQLKALTADFSMPVTAPAAENYLMGDPMAGTECVSVRVSVRVSVVSVCVSVCAMRSFSRAGCERTARPQYALPCLLLAPWRQMRWRLRLATS